MTTDDLRAERELQHALMGAIVKWLAIDDAGPQGQLAPNELTNIAENAILRYRNELSFNRRATSLFATINESGAGKYAARIAELERENFSLAAGQCPVKGGLCGDDYGHQYCALEARLARVTEAAKELLANLGTIEVLGEWSALDMNPVMSAKERARVNRIVADLESALAQEPQQ